MHQELTIVLRDHKLLQTFVFPLFKVSHAHHLMQMIAIASDGGLKLESCAETKMVASIVLSVAAIYFSARCERIVS